MKTRSLHICVFTQSPLTRAPRVVKEANVYVKAGYKVTVYAAWHNQKLLDSDRLLLDSSITYKAGVNLLDWNGYQSKIIRFKSMFGRTLVKYFGIQTRLALGYDFKNYLKKLQSENVDLYIGHEEMSMALAKELILRGKKVAFDFEDWHSKDLLPKDRVYRPIKLLEQLERYLLVHAVYCYSTSEAMSKAMSDYHQTPKPEVVYNSFYTADRNRIDGLQNDLKHHQTPSVHWFSQVIGKGRGLELLFECLPLVKTPFQLHLRGQITEAYAQELKSLMPKHIELYIHKLVPPGQLVSRIAEHDLGIAFEEIQPLSRNYTITNKVFHYLQSGIAILATETSGQQEIASKAPKAVKIVHRNSRDIAEALDLILSDLEILQERKDASHKAGQDIFAFESQAVHLLQMTNKILIF